MPRCKLICGMSANKAFAICGIAAPFVYLLLTIIGGLLSPGYSHIKDSVSELLIVGAPNKPLLNAIMIIYGILLCLYPIGLHRGINQGKGSKVGPTCLVVVGVVTLLSVFFPQDPGGPPVTFAGTVHIALVVLMVIFSLIAYLAFWRRLKSDSLWAGYDRYTLITFFVAIVFGAISAIFLDSPYVGLLERLSAGVIVQWTFFMAIKLYRLPR